MRDIRMKRMLFGMVAAAVIAAPAAFAATKMVCKDTGKDLAGKCCCDTKDGKFICSFSKKTHDKCCCETKS